MTATLFPSPELGIYDMMTGVENGANIGKVVKNVGDVNPVITLCSVWERK